MRQAPRQAGHPPHQQPPPTSLGAIGVVLSVKADLGVSPISCVPYVFSLAFPLTLGQTTIILNVLLIFLQMLLLRRRYRFFQLVQFPVVFLFDFFIDLIMKYSDWMMLTDYFEQALLCLLGCILGRDSASIFQAAPSDLSTLTE